MKNLQREDFARQCKMFKNSWFSIKVCPSILGFGVATTQHLNSRKFFWLHAQPATHRTEESGNILLKENTCGGRRRPTLPHRKCSVTAKEMEEIIIRKNEGKTFIQSKHRFYLCQLLQTKCFIDSEIVF